MTILHATPSAARRRLMEIGVPIEPIISSVRAGFDGRGLCTPNDPPFIPGTEAWRYVVRTLRERLLPLGWRKSDPGNYSIVSSDVREINIVVASADKFVKRTGGDPRTKSLKGLYTEAAIARNLVNLDLFPDTIPENVRVAAAALEYPTWILLIHITDDDYRAELSFPELIEDQMIVSWAERIFIPNDGSPIIEDGSGQGDTDFDVPVRRRV
jgi:hypothetical protein